MWFHSHDYLEIMYCDSGSFGFEVNKNDKTVFTKKVLPGECVVITDSAFHKVVRLPDIPCKIFNIEFEICAGIDNVYMCDYTYLLKMSHGLAELAEDPQGFSIVKSAAGFRDTLLSLLKLLASDSDAFEDKLQQRILIYQLFALLGKSKSFSSKKIGIHYLRNAVNYIHSNLLTPIRLDDIVQAAGVSKSYLQRLFRNYYQMQVHEYVCSKRVEHSTQLLTDTQYDQTQIALMSGFNNYNQFLYSFKKFCGITPGEYRNKFQNIDHVDQHWQSTAIDE